MPRHRVGKGMSHEDLLGGSHMTFRVAAVAGGDEVPTLASEAIVSGVSIEFLEVPDGTDVQTRAGRRTSVDKRQAPGRVASLSACIPGAEVPFGIRAEAMGEPWTRTCVPFQPT